MKALVLGAGGQVGRALMAALPDAVGLSHDQLDIADVDSSNCDWRGFDVVINCAAWTDVDAAETPEGRRSAWRANASGPAAVAEVGAAHGLLIVHLSTEYVFDGTFVGAYSENAGVAPLSVYGASKAAGDLAVQARPRHYVLRPTWVVGDGRNFVRTMVGLADRGISPSVVADQVGRPTFVDDIANAVVQLVEAEAPYGPYHVTGGGPPASWAEVARTTFQLAGHAELAIQEVTTADWFADKPAAAPRPRNSVLDTSKAERAGVATPDWRTRLAEYVERLRSERT